MFVVVLSALLLTVQGDFTTSLATTTPYVTPTPHIIGEHYRPYFWQDHPNICGRIPELRVVGGKKKSEWEFYEYIDNKPSIIYLAEAQCGTCQSNAALAGHLAKRWEEFKYKRGRGEQAVDIKVVAVNRNLPASRKKFGMMDRQLRKRWNVRPWVSLHQDNDESQVWEDLGDYMVENVGPFYNETRPFKSRRNDMYLVDQWGRMVRFLRDAVLDRSRKSGATTNLHWRDVVHNVMLKTKDGKTVCDELQHEWLYCRVPEEWELNGVSFRNLRQGHSLTILVFIRADMEEFTIKGLLKDLVDLSERWGSPSYVAVADSIPASKSRFATVDLYLQTRNSGVRLLQDEDNAVASKYFAAPGDLFAIDSLGRIIGFINRVNLQDEGVEAKLKDWHLNWNPECDRFMTESFYTGTGTTGTPPTATQPHFYTSSYYYK